MEQHESEKPRHTGRYAALSVACFAIGFIAGRIGPELPGSVAWHICLWLSGILFILGIVFAGKVVFNVFNTIDVLHKNNAKRE
jgi:MFS family permease